MVNTAEVVIEGGEVFPAKAWLPRQQAPGMTVVLECLRVPAYPLAPEPARVECLGEAGGRLGLRGSDVLLRATAASGAIQRGTLAFGVPARSVLSH
jgi:hypothetical protein